HEIGPEPAHPGEDEVAVGPGHLGHEGEGGPADSVDVSEAEEPVARAGWVSSCHPSRPRGKAEHRAAAGTIPLSYRPDSAGPVLPEVRARRRRDGLTPPRSPPTGRGVCAGRCAWGIRGMELPTSPRFGRGAKAGQGPVAPPRLSITRANAGRRTSQ